MFHEPPAPPSVGMGSPVLKRLYADLSTPDFPGIFERGDGYFGPRLTPASHPHLLLEKAMTSVPHVSPGDTVFWHCDMVHSVETEHTGSDDSAGKSVAAPSVFVNTECTPYYIVMYIPACPLTPQNLAYIQRQKDYFLKGASPPDYPKTAGEDKFAGTGKEGDIVGDAARQAMGLAY